MKMGVVAIGLVLLVADASLAQEGAKPAATAEESARKSPPKDLLVGEKAPPLAIEKWIKGDPVAKFESGKIYVIEFWATWCGPCIQAQPHLTELQAKYKDKGVTFIGVTSLDDRNTLDAVEAMVKKRDDKMGYTVAWDKGRTTNEAFMDAARQGGIPCAFLVDQEGTLAWVGHPLSLDGPLEKVIDKKWDVKKAAEEFKSELEENKAMEESGEQIGQFQEAMEKKDYAAALKIVDELAEKKPALASQLAFARFHVLMESKQYDKAYAAADQAADKLFAKKAQPLTQFARMILTVEGVEKHNADLALKLANKALEITPEEAFILDTIAMAYAEKGDHAKAAEALKKAISLAEKQRIPDEALADLKDRLKDYEARANGEKKDADKKP